MTLYTSPQASRVAWSLRLARFLAIVLSGAYLTGCAVVHRARNEDLGANVAPGDQPDKILFQKAANEITKGRYDVGRLTLQVLINTYPDSEYLSRAKLLTAQSYYKQGGVSGLTQAEAEYKDFETFFPTAPEAPRAQYLAGMCHYRLMGKPDRDLTEARDAEAEFKIFLDKYPDNELVPVVKGHLREVQEVLATGDFATARLYFRRGAMRAASSRFQEIADNYPDYSQADQALWYMGQSLEKLHKQNDAVAAYGRILTDYPLSASAKPATARLEALHKPVPVATKATLARAEADREVAKQVHHSLISDLEGAFSGAPDMSETRHGPVHLGAHPSNTLQAQGSGASPGANIAVEPLGDSSKPANPSPSSAASTPSTENPTTGAAAAPAATSPTSAAPASPDPAASSGKPAASEAASSDPNAKTADAKPDASTGTQKAQNADSADSAPKDKKKGKLHFLKKLDPF
ncbi:MAG TPA: outer membrane protein assembly factor BamD [Terriglobia bacterium]|nr:outer membrane protein assembly factor BamD [Terriglobia bacterium]